MHFEIMNRESARRYSYEPHFDKSVIISISDAGASRNKFGDSKKYGSGIVDVLFLFFDDVEAGEPNPISRSDAAAIADFVKRYEKTVDKIIVHCNAGVSRSAGVCAAIMKYMTGDDMALFGKAFYCPNSTCYRYVLEALLGVYELAPQDEDEFRKKISHNVRLWIEGAELNS